MFNLFDSKKVEIFAPVAGKIMDITKVNDLVFANKLTGDGFAIEPEGNVIQAPCDGKIAYVATSGHAICVLKEGVEVMIHVGIDTVELGGEGFELLVEPEAEVKKGDTLLKFDRALIASRGKASTVTVTITNMDGKVKKITKNLSVQDGPVLVVTAK